MLVAVLAASALLACAASGAVAALHLLPLSLLAMLLLVGRYPGESRLAGRLCRPRAAGRRTPPFSHGARPRPLLPRGGLLMGFAMAVRPPPAAAGPR